MECLNPKCHKKKNLNVHGLCDSCAAMCESLRHISDEPEVVTDYLDELRSILDKMKSNKAVDYNTMMTALFGGILSLSEDIRKCNRDLENKIEGTQNKLDVTIEKLSDAEARITILESSISKPDFDLKPSLVIQKLPRSETKSDMELVIEVFREINAEGVSESEDIVKVKRVGHCADKVGTILVEMKSEDDKIKVMKAKKSLMKHQNLMLRKLKIRNMKSLEQMNQENNLYKILSLIPSGDQFVLSGSGKIVRRNDLAN